MRSSQTGVIQQSKQPLPFYRCFNLIIKAIRYCDNILTTLTIHGTHHIHSVQAVSGTTCTNHMPVAQPHRDHQLINRLATTPQAEHVMCRRDEAARISVHKSGLSHREEVEAAKQALTCSNSNDQRPWNGYGGWGQKITDKSLYGWCNNLKANN